MSAVINTHVYANGLKTARVVKLLFHTVLLGGKNTNTRIGIWKMGAGAGFGGFRGVWVGG